MKRRATVEFAQRLARAAETVFVTAPRQVIPQRIHLLTRRVQQGQFLLLPRKEVRQLFDYCLAVAAHQYGVVLYGWFAMSNHYHLLVGDVHGNFPEFLAWLNRLTGRLLNAKWKRCENFWAAEQPSAVWCVTAEDAFAKLIYLLVNAVAAHLVDRASAWPGSSSLLQNMGGPPVVIERPAAFFSKRSKLPKTIELRAARLPGFEHLSDEKYFRKVADAVRYQENLARQRRAATKRTTLGCAAVLAQSHLDFPKQPLKRGGRPEIACREKRRRRSVERALEAFRAAHLEARERFCVGDREVVFPAGTYRILRYGAICAPCVPDACGQAA